VENEKADNHISLKLSHGKPWVTGFQIIPGLVIPDFDREPRITLKPNRPRALRFMTAMYDHKNCISGIIIGFRPVG
jgi:hypothetical protein